MRSYSMVTYCDFKALIYSMVDPLSLRGDQVAFNERRLPIEAGTHYRQLFAQCIKAVGRINETSYRRAPALFGAGAG